MTREGSVSLNTRVWAVGVAGVGVFPSAGVPAGYFQHENANSESPRGAEDGRPGPRSRSQLYVATLALFERYVKRGTV